MTRQGPASVRLPPDVRERWADVLDALSPGLVPASSADALRHLVRAVLDGNRTAKPAESSKMSLDVTHACVTGGE